MTIEKVYCPVGCVQNIAWQRDLSTGGWGIVSVLYSVFLCSLPSGDWNYNCMWLKRRSANILEFMLGESHDFFLQFFLLFDIIFEYYGLRGVEDTDGKDGYKHVKWTDECRMMN